MQVLLSAEGGISVRSGTKRIFSSLLLLPLAWVGVQLLLPLSLPFLLGLSLAWAAEPMVGFLSKKLPRPLSSALGVTMTCLSLGALVILLCALIVRELGVLAGILPALEQTALAGVSRVQDWLTGLTRQAPRGLRTVLDQNLTAFFSDGTALVNRALGYGISLAGNLLSHIPDGALMLGTGIISSFLLSAKLPRIRLWWHRLLSRERLKPLLAALKGAREAAGGYLLAQLKLAGVTLVILILGLVLLRVPYAPLWALGIALVDAFPILGTGTVLLPWAAGCLVLGDTARALGLLGIYVTVSLTRSILEPRFIGRHLGLDPLVTLMALYAGYKLWGIGGMLIAPVLAVSLTQLLPGENPQ